MTDAEALRALRSDDQRDGGCHRGCSGVARRGSARSVSGASPGDLMAAPNLVSFLADEIFQKARPANEAFAVRTRDV